MDLLSVLHGAQVERPSLEQIKVVCSRLGRIVSEENIFVVRGASGCGVVVAAAMTGFENDLDMFESALEAWGNVST